MGSTEELSEDRMARILIAEDEEALRGFVARALVHGRARR